MTPDLVVPHVVSNAFALLLAGLLWRRPTAGRRLGAVLFLAAGAFNLYQAATAPQIYAGFRPFVWLDAYRWVIDAVLPAYGPWFIGAIALGQAVVGSLLARGGRAARLGAWGAIAFFAGITPLGLGSAFPFPLVAAAGFAAFLTAPTRGDGPIGRPRPRHP
jgi:hypothetical protein